MSISEKELHCRTAETRPSNQHVLNPSRVSAHNQLLSPTMKRPWEPLFLAATGFALILVPLSVKELYPFSLPTMFSAAPKQLARYTVSTPEGDRIRLDRVSLHVQEWHDPPVRTWGRKGYGRARAPSVHVLGEVATEAQIEAAIRRAWIADPTLPPRLQVRQEVFSRSTHGSIERSSVRTWRWSREALHTGSSGASGADLPVP